MTARFDRGLAGGYALLIEPRLEIRSRDREARDVSVAQFTSSPEQPDVEKGQAVDRTIAGSGNFHADMPSPTS
jgi:hypothetical protein